MSAFAATTRIGAALTLAALAACGDSPTTEPAMIVEAACQAVTAWSYPATKVGQTALTMFVAHRAGGATATPVTMTIDGPDAAAFTVDATSSSTCDDAPALADSDVCTRRLGFTPTATRAYAATLHLGATAIALHGPEVAAGGLTARLANVDLVAGGISTPDFVETLIVKDGPTAVDLTGITATGDDLEVAVSGTCGQGTLAAGGACMARLAAQQRRHGGCVAGAFTVGSSAGPLIVPITSRFLGAVEVSVTGEGAGRVVSTPPGIDCARGGGRCAHVFLDDADVTLAATATDGAHFNGWGYGPFVQGAAPCQADPASCRVSPVTAALLVNRGELATGRVGASFASAQARAVSVTFAGDGRGRVTGGLDCTSSCRGWVEPGVDASLDAFTPSRFGGWQGACSGGASNCALGPVVNDRAVTVTFDRDERELATLLIAPAILAGAFTTDGDLLTVTEDGRLARRAVDGTIRWTTELVGPTAALPAAARVQRRAADAIYVLMPGELATLVKLDDTGAVTWRRDVGGVTADWMSMAVLVDGRIAVVNAADHRVRVWTAAGDVDWSATPEVPISVGESPAGTVVVATLIAPNLRRFDGGGIELPAWSVAAGRDLMVADRQGRLALHGPDGFRRLDASGAVTFAEAPLVDGRVVGLSLTAAGDLLAVSSVRPALARTTGLHLETFGGGGSNWTLDEPRLADESAVYTTDSACDVTGHCALFGYATRDHRTANGWIELFTIP